MAILGIHVSFRGSISSSSSNCALQRQPCGASRTWWCQWIFVASAMRQCIGGVSQAGKGKLNFFMFRVWLIICGWHNRRLDHNDAQVEWNLVVIFACQNKKPSNLKQNVAVFGGKCGIRKNTITSKIGRFILWIPWNGWTTKKSIQLILLLMFFFRYLKKLPIFDLGNAPDFQGTFVNVWGNWWNISEVFKSYSASKTLIHHMGFWARPVFLFGGMVPRSFVNVFN